MPEHPPTLGEQIAAFLATRKGRALVALLLVAVPPAAGLPAGVALPVVEAYYDVECVPAEFVKAFPGVATGAGAPPEVVVPADPGTAPADDDGADDEASPADPPANSDGT